MKALIVHEEQLVRYGIISVLKKLSIFQEILDFEKLDIHVDIAINDNQNIELVIAEINNVSDIDYFQSKGVLGKIPIVYFNKQSNIPPVQRPHILSLSSTIGLDDFIRIISNLLTSAGRLKYPLSRMQLLRSFHEAEKIISLADFSLRRRQILELIALGLPNREIAKQLEITEATVKSNLQTIKKMLNVRNRTEMAIWYNKNSVVK